MADTEHEDLARVSALLLEEYEVIRLLGRGGMAAVYLAREHALKRLVAVKVLDRSLAESPGFRARFEREASTAAQLQHPNIVPIYRVGELGGVPFFTMAYVEGENLADRLRHRGRFPLDEATAITRQIAAALGAAHRRGIVHRDVKPHNVLIDRESGRVMVTDFGIARISEVGPLAGSDPDSVTGAGIVMGTPRYMSPEQAVGTRDLTPASDLYALGVLLYEMVSGSYPYRVATPPNFQVAHLTQSPMPLVAHIGDFPLAAEAVIQRLLAKDPADRFQDAEQLLEALRALEPEAPVGGRGRGVWWGGHGRGRRAVVMLGGLVVVAGALSLMARGPAPPREDPRRSVLIGFFENTTGDADLEWLRIGGVEQLAQSLGRWRDLKVVHLERLLDLARRAKIADGAPMSQDDALRLARAAGVGTATVGSLIGTGDDIRVTVRVYDVRTRDLVTTATASGAADSTLPRLFERLADQILDLSGVATGTLAAVEPPTRSIDAYRAYIDGVAARSRWEMEDAAAAFTRAIALDPGFALAYYELSLALLPAEWLRGESRFVRLADSARIHAADRPPVERLLIEAYDAFVHGNLPLARSRYQELVARDSGLADAWTGLADASALDLTLRRDTRGREYLAASYSEALRGYERALALDGNDHRTYGNLVNLLSSAVLEDFTSTIPGFREPPTGDVPTLFSRIPVRFYRAVYLGDSLPLVPAESLTIRYPAGVLDSSRRAARRRLREVLDRWLEVAPNEGTAHLFLARLDAADGRIDKALQALDRAEALEAVSPIPVPALRLATLLDGKRIPEAAAAADAIQRAPAAEAMPDILYGSIANAYLAAGRIAAAKEAEERLWGSLGRRGQTAALTRLTDLLGPSQQVLVDASLDRVSRRRVEVLERETERRIAAAPEGERKELIEVGARPLVIGYARLGDTARVAFWRRRSGERGIHGLDALAALRAGDTVEAARRYRLAQRDTTGSAVTKAAMAETALALGKADDALGYYEAMDTLSLLTLQAPDPAWLDVVRSWPARARLLLGRGSVEEARVWYQKFLDAWTRADPELGAMRDQVRRELGPRLRLDREDVPKR